MLSFAGTVAKRAMQGAIARAPASVKDAVGRVQRRYEEGVLDAQTALEELGAIEERVARLAIGLVAFPFVATGAIRELYGRVTELEGKLEQRDDAIRALEARLRELESLRGVNSPSAHSPPPPSRR